MPRLGGTKGKDYEKVCECIEDKFKNALKNIQNASDSILNVQASNWYDHMKYFRDTIQEIEVKTLNIIYVVILQNGKFDGRAVLKFVNLGEKSIFSFLTYSSV